MVFENRISKYPGRWTLVREDGSSEIVTLVRNDEPIKDGTPINASTLNELSTVAGAINAKEEAVSAANSAAEERAKAEQAAKNAAKDVSAIVKADSENAALSAAAAKTSEINSKRSESQSATYLQGTKEYFEQVRTITIGAQGWYATPEALKAGGLSLALQTPSGRGTTIQNRGKTAFKKPIFPTTTPKPRPTPNSARRTACPQLRSARWAA